MSSAVSPVTSPLCKITLYSLKLIVLIWKAPYKLPQQVESLSTRHSQCDYAHTNTGLPQATLHPHPPTLSPLTDSETFRLQSSSAFFSRELTHSLRFCLQRDAAARFLSRKRCLRSSGSSSTVRRRRPPVGCAGDT